MKQTVLCSFLAMTFAACVASLAAAQTKPSGPDSNRAADRGAVLPADHRARRPQGQGAAAV